MQWSLICAILAGLALLFPEESYFYAEVLYLKFKTFLLNVELFIRSYIIYRKLKADFDRLQIPAPVFRFTPIQDRR